MESSKINSKKIISDQHFLINHVFNVAIDQNDEDCMKIEKSFVALYSQTQKLLSKSSSLGSLAETNNLEYSFSMDALLGFYFEITIPFGKYGKLYHDIFDLYSRSKLNAQFCFGCSKLSDSSIAIELIYYEKGYFLFDQDHTLLD